jgi:hypothetical protein
MAVDKNQPKGATVPLDTTKPPVERATEPTSSVPTANPYEQLAAPAPPSGGASSGGTPAAKPLAGAAAPATALAGQSTQPATQPASQPVTTSAATPTVGAASPAPAPPPGGGKSPDQPKPTQPIDNPYTALTGTGAGDTAPVQNTYVNQQTQQTVTPANASKADQPTPQDTPTQTTPPDTLPLGTNAIASNAGNAGTPQAGAAGAGLAERNAPPPAAQTASGFINFDQLAGANSGVSKRESDKRANDAMMSAKKAQQELQALQQQYTKQVNAGTLQGPNEADQGWAQYGDGVQEAPIRPAPGTEILQPSNSDIQNEITAGANNAGYGGPNALSALDAYGQLTQDTGAAQQGIGALQSNEGLQGLGMNQTDAALLGGAGRSQFAKLGDQYGGLQKDLDSANTASIGQADAARSQTDAAKAAYQGLLDQRAQTDQAATDKAKSDADAVQAAIGAAGGIDPLGGGVKYPGLHDTKTDSSGHTVWGDDVNDNFLKQVGYGDDFNKASDISGPMPKDFSKWFNVSMTDADYVVGNMTETDWAKYQTAAKSGPDAMKAWFDDILKRRKS